MLSKLNKKLYEAFGGAVQAQLEGSPGGTFGGSSVLRLTGKLSDWKDIVRAGRMSVNKKKYGVVNDIVFTGAEIPPMKMPPLSDNALDGLKPDVMVIGGGVTGCAIARYLMRYKLNVLLIEKEHDLAVHASGRNDGMVHPGADLKHGLHKKKYNDRGNKMYPQLCAELGLPFQYTGQYICFNSKLIQIIVFASLVYWKIMGIPVEFLGRKKLREQEPHLNKEAAAAFFAGSLLICSLFSAAGKAAMLLGNQGLPARSAAQFAVKGFA